MKKSVNVIFKTDDIKCIECLPKFQRVFEYPILDAQYTDRREWGRIRSGDDFVRFLAFSHLDVDAFAAFNGGKSSIESFSLETKYGIIRITIPTLEFLNEAIKMIMYKISANMTTYPPDFKIFSEMSANGDFCIKYEVK